MNNLTFFIIVIGNSLGLLAFAKDYYHLALAYATYLTVLSGFLFLGCYFSLYILIPSLVSSVMTIIAYLYAKILILQKPECAHFGFLIDGNDASYYTLDRMQAQLIEMKNRAEPQKSSKCNPHSTINMNPVEANPRIP